LEKLRRGGAASLTWNRLIGALLPLQES
jgi:hypothetical protein